MIRINFSHMNIVRIANIVPVVQGLQVVERTWLLI